MWIYRIGEEKKKKGKNGDIGAHTQTRRTRNGMFFFPQLDNK